jgi:Uri superfamily endonuclease
MALKPEPGTYALFCRAESDAWIEVGCLGTLRVRPGLYVYVGSALGPGGLAGRISHHARPAKKAHWHIDSLRAHTRLESIWYSYGAQRREHVWAAAFKAAPGVSVPQQGFGASDCACDSHLFYFGQPPSLRAFAARLRALDPAHPRLLFTGEQSGWQTKRPLPVFTPKAGRGK